MRTTILLAALAAKAVLAQPEIDAAAAIDTLDAQSAEERGYDFWQGRGVERNAAEAARWFEIAAAEGRPVAQYLLAEQYRTGAGVTRDPARAFGLYRQSAERGVAAAEMMVGQAYFFGIGVARDVDAAVGWIRDAARQENPEALFMLASLYGTGQGVELDDALAFRLSLRAAALGHTRAAATVGTRFIYDLSLRDVDKGIYYLRKSATSNDPFGAYLLAQEYLRGVDLSRDFGLAAQWLTQAARGPLPIASLWLSLLYEKGLGVDANAARSTELLEAGLAKATPEEQNRFAWALAVKADAELRDGALAVRVMEHLTADPGGRNPAYIDTLAAAYAEAGQFDAAAKAETQAIAALPPAVTAEQRQAFESRLALYRGGAPYRESR